MLMTQSASPQIDAELLKGYADKIRVTGKIAPELYQKYDVRRGLRNPNGSGVLVGLTNIGSVHGYVTSESEKVSVPGQLFYRGINVADFVKGFQSEHRFGFEECAYLLLMGELPKREELVVWKSELGALHRLPDGFKETAIIRSPGVDIMNSIARAVLTAYIFDPAPDRLDLETTLRQSIELIAQFPTIAAYAYQAKAHYHLGQSMVLRYPDPELSTAENFLRLIRADGYYSRFEAEVLDLCLVLHAEHGGGTNSTFTTHVMSSAFTDTYAAIASAVLSLKGLRHGGANLRVMKQMSEAKKKIKHWDNENEVADHLWNILKREAGDGTGLIYGLGHAVYTLSDPRAEMLRDCARALAKSKGREEEMGLYETVERLGPEIFNQFRGGKHDLCCNVDFYSGFVYDMLNIPNDLFTPIFAVARVVGWCAHRLEELINGGPIIRPAYKALTQPRKYVPQAERG